MGGRNWSLLIDADNFRVVKSFVGQEYFKIFVYRTIEDLKNIECSYAIIALSNQFPLHHGALWPWSLKLANYRKHMGIKSNKSTGLFRYA